MLNLDDIIRDKTIVIQNKTIKIPKLSVYHYSLIENMKEPEEIVKVISDSIQKGLTKAQRELVVIHTLAYNGKLKNQVELNGEKLSIDDIQISQKLKFNIDDYEFKFKTPTDEQLKLPPTELLKSCCTSVKKDNVKIEFDFNKMPIFGIRWIEQIVTLVEIKTKKTHIKGLEEILEVFDGNQIGG